MPLLIEGMNRSMGDAIGQNRSDNIIPRLSNAGLILWGKAVGGEEGFMQVDRPGSSKIVDCWQSL